jgi:hypothetical protein
MSWICEITVTGDPAQVAALDAWLSNTAAATWTALPHLQALDIYEPASETSRDPYNHQEAGPLLIATLEFGSEGDLQQAMNTASFLEVLKALPFDLRAMANAFRRAFYGPDGDEVENNLSAPVSYVVRYYNPADDALAFIENYVGSHPPTQAKLPAIRSIMCYFPRPDLASREWPTIDYLIGNEVVFDSVDDFNEAMQSPVREELRAHFKEFPPFSGRNSHFLMLRRRLHG